MTLSGAGEVTDGGGPSSEICKAGPSLAVKARALLQRSHPGGLPDCPPATLRRWGPHADYDRMAGHYDRLHARWLCHAGGEAQAALEAAVRVIIRPGMSLLDVGCGTGAFARRLLAEVDGVALTLLDPSTRMLMRCADLHCRLVEGSAEALPFSDRTFDIVTCGWALETAEDPARAVREMCRAVRPGGILVIAFCADRESGSFSAHLLRRAVLLRRTGQFLPVKVVEAAISDSGAFEVMRLPCRGPVGVLLALAAPPMSVVAPGTAPAVQHPRCSLLADGAAATTASAQEIDIMR